MATSSSAPKPTIGILSIGEMGMGIAKRLRANDYVVSTNAAGRSKHTVERIERAEIIAYDSDERLVAEADIILSIVPPRDAVATSKRILDASRSQDAIKQRAARRETTPTNSAPNLVYIDLNAISPRTTKGIHALLLSEPTPASPRRLSLSRTFNFGRSNSTSEEAMAFEALTIDFLDGGIIGPPPTLNAETSSWKLPSVIISGPESTTSRLPPDLLSTLNMKAISPTIGSASALKACFASLTKGLTALSVLSFTTAHTCGVLAELQSHLAEFSPATLALAKAGLTGMPPKAYRWVDEMRQIGETFSEEGGFDGGDKPGEKVYGGIAELYKLIANDTLLGDEKTGSRKRGKDVEDVAECVREGLRAKKRKGAGEEGKLDLAWRGSWS